MFAGADFHAVCGRGLRRHLLAQTLTAFLDVDFGGVCTRFGGFGGVCASSSKQPKCWMSRPPPSLPPPKKIKTTEATELTETQTLALLAGADFGGVHIQTLLARTWQHLQAQTLKAFSDADFGGVCTCFGAFARTFAAFAGADFSGVCTSSPSSSKQPKHWKSRPLLLPGNDQNDQNDQKNQSDRSDQNN